MDRVWEKGYTVQKNRSSFIPEMVVEVAGKPGEVSWRGPYKNWTLRLKICLRFTNSWGMNFHLPSNDIINQEEIFHHAQMK